MSTVNLENKTILVTGAAGFIGSNLVKRIYTLWSAALYQEADTIREATDAALELYEIVTGGKDLDRSLWTAASHKSLCAGFNEADPDAIIAWNKRMADLVTMDGIAKAIRDQVPAGSIRKLQSLTKIQKEWLRKRLRKADFGEKMRLHYYLGVILEDENEVQECFRIIQSEVLEATIKSLMILLPCRRPAFLPAE